MKRKMLIVTLIAFTLLILFVFNKFKIYDGTLYMKVNSNIFPQKYQLYKQPFKECNGEYLLDEGEKNPVTFLCNYDHYLFEADGNIYYVDEVYEHPSLSISKFLSIFEDSNLRTESTALPLWPTIPFKLIEVKVNMINKV